MGRENRPLFAWYGDMEMVPHLWEALLAGPLDVVVQFHEPLSLDGAWTERPWQPARAKTIQAGRPKAWPGRGLVRRPAIPLCRPDKPSRNEEAFGQTYGCQMNAYDPPKMADLLAPLGYAATVLPRPAW